MYFSEVLCLHLRAQVITGNYAGISEVSIYEGRLSLSLYT